MHKLNYGSFLQPNSQLPDMDPVIDESHLLMERGAKADAGEARTTK